MRKNLCFSFNLCFMEQNKSKPFSGITTHDFKFDLLTDFKHAIWRQTLSHTCPSNGKQEDTCCRAIFVKRIIEAACLRTYFPNNSRYTMCHFAIILTQVMHCMLLGNENHTYVL